jgi:hypothetical protein
VASKIKELQMTTSAVPTQWEGQLEDGRFFYARYRHGILRLGVGETPVDAARAGLSEALMGPVHGYIWLDERRRELGLKENEKLPEKELNKIADKTQQFIEEEKKKERGTVLFQEQVGDELDGVMSTDVMLDHLKEHITR